MLLWSRRVELDPEMNLAEDLSWTSHKAPLAKEVQQCIKFIHILRRAGAPHPKQRHL